MKINKLFVPGLLGNLLSIALGILITFAFAPCQLYLLAVLLPALLFALWQTVTPREAFKRGWLFGFGMFGAGVYWIYISIHTYGNAPVWLAAFFTIGFIAILAIFPGLAGYLLNRYFPYMSRSRIFYAFPAIWVFLEWMRSIIFTGFPWLLLGYSQINSPLKGYAAIVGVYGLSLLVLFSSAMLIQIYIDLKQKRYKSSLYYVLALTLLWSIGAYLNTKSWTHSFGNPVKVSLVQGNIAQEIKWSPESAQATLDTYKNLTEPNWNSNIIIWPESAITIPAQYAGNYLDEMDARARKHQTTLITGIPVQAVNAKNYFNAVIVLGNGKGIYAKRRLVPFGEYTPLNEWVGKLLDFLKIPMSDFIPSPNKPLPLIANNVRIATFICYEIAFPELVYSKDANINMLLTVSNDAWFGHSIAQAQHLEMAQMRAAESGRPVLFVSNNGITAIIKPSGKIQSAAPPYVSYVLTDTVQPVEGITPWQKTGLDSILFLITFLIIYSIREQRVLKRTKFK